MLPFVNHMLQIYLLFDVKTELHKRFWDTSWFSLRYRTGVLFVQYLTFISDRSSDPRWAMPPYWIILWRRDCKRWKLQWAFSGNRIAKPPNCWDEHSKDWGERYFSAVVVYEYSEKRKLSLGSNRFDCKQLVVAQNILVDVQFLRSKLSSLHKWASLCSSWTWKAIASDFTLISGQPGETMNLHQYDFSIRVGIVAWFVWETNNLRFCFFLVLRCYFWIKFYS